MLHVTTGERYNLKPVKHLKMEGVKMLPRLLQICYFIHISKVLIITPKLNALACVENSYKWVLYR